MVSFYEEMQKVATGVLKEFAQGVVSYVTFTNSGGTPDDPGEPVPVVHSINAAVRGVAYKYIDGTNIVASDGQLTMPVTPGLTPTDKGFIDVDGKRHRIMSVQQIPAAGTPVAYIIIFKR